MYAPLIREWVQVKGYTAVFLVIRADYDLQLSTATLRTLARRVAPSILIDATATRAQFRSFRHNRCRPDSGHNPYRFILK